MERGEFRGRIGRYHWESEAYWPPEPSAPAGAPNVLIVLLDDVGFAQLGCFGSDIATPTFDALAASGLRYANFHTTGLCSPTRACVLTGRNHHSCGMGRPDGTSTAHAACSPCIARRPWRSGTSVTCPSGDMDARYLCADRRQGLLCADGSGPEALVKVERPQRSEDVRP